MTPTQAEQDQRSSLLIVGALVGLFVGAALGGGGTWAWWKWASARVHKGWNLVPVVVSKRDLPPGTKLVTDDVEVRSVPEQFVSEPSTIKPSSVSFVINQPVLVPIAAGEPLRRGLIATWEKPLDPLADAAAIDACAREAAARLPPEVQHMEQQRSRLERMPR